MTNYKEEYFNEGSEICTFIKKPYKINGSFCIVIPKRLIENHIDKPVFVKITEAKRKPYDGEFTC